MKRAFIFDMDGTVVDSMPSYRQLAVDVMVKHLPLSPGKAEQIYLDTIGLPFEEQLNSHGYVSAKAVKEYHDRGRFISRESKPFDGFREFINMHDNAETHFGIISSSSLKTVLDTINCHFNNMVDWASGIETGSKLAQINHFLEYWDIQPERAMYFGDTFHDAKFAEQANVKFTLIEGEHTWKALTGTHS